MSRISYQNRKRMRRIRKGPKEDIFLARLGDGSGMVVVPGQPLYRYVRAVDSDGVLVVRRGAAPDIEGLKVWVGVDPIYRHMRKILGVSSGDSSTGVGAMQAHWETHAEGGSDQGWFTDRQITPLLCYPTTGMSVKVYGGWATYQGQPIHVATTTISLTTSIPVAGARYSLIRISSAGAVSVQDGVAVGSLADLDNSDIPDCADGYAPLAFVRLYVGQTALSKLTTSPDVKMLVWGGGLFDSSASGNATSIQGIPVAGEVPNVGDVLFYDGVNWNPGAVISHEHIFQEDLSALCDNVTVAFATANVFETDSTHVFLNGLMLAPANDYDNGDYTEDVDLQGITFETAPLSSDSLFIAYIRSIGAAAS